MVSDNRRDPQRKSTRPVQGDGTQWRPTGTGAQPTRRPGSSRTSAPGSIEPRATGLRAYDAAARNSAAAKPTAVNLTAVNVTAADARTRPQARTQAPRATGSTRTARPAAASGRQARPNTAPGKSGGKGGKGGPPLDKHGNPMPRWKFWLRRLGFGALFTGLAVALLGFTALFIRYQTLDIPPPSDFALQEASTVYYADGTTVMGRLGQAERDIIDINTLPPYVPNAFVAAEDRSFYTNPGVDFVGTGRALVKTVVFGKKQGGSTITQQYVERYYKGETVTDMGGKIDEALLALKISKTQEKTEILGNYMNTVYFGRGAYGIEAAAREYYGKHAAELTASEAALLAGILPAPSRWDPRLNPEQAEFRWNYVLDGMVEGGYVTAEDRAVMTFPATIEYSRSDIYGGTQGYLLRAAIDEVTATTGKTQEEIETQGLSIVTTIVPATQQSIQAAVAQMPTDAAPNLRVAALTLDPTTGAITGMYGGADYLTIQRNAVTQDIAQAGSTFKPFALVAALENGKSLASTYNGANKKAVDGFDSPVRNFMGANFGDIDLVQATASSVNTVYAQLNVEIGPDKTRDVAVRAGIPDDTLGLEENPSNVLGTASPHALDLAAAYSTFATGGLRTEPFMVASVTLADDTLYYEHQAIQERVFEADVMADTTYAMQQVINQKSGSGHFAAELGRPIAGKTGTSNENRSAWFVGFTPQQVGVVGMYQVGPNGEAEEITPFGGFEQITGGSMPVRIWTWMMGPVFADMPVVDFPARADVGVATTPSPSPPPVVTPSPSPSPTPTPTPSPSPTPVVTPTPTPAPPAPPAP